MRQFAGFGTAEETNERFHYLIDEGQTGLSTAFDMPSLMGLDSDDPMSLGEVGKEGVAVDTLRDMEILFDGIDLDEVSTSFTINPSAPVIYAMYLALADQQGVPREEIRGPSRTTCSRSSSRRRSGSSPGAPLDLVTDVVEYCATETPKFHPISISGYHIREAGSTAVQELAFTLADGFAYVENGIERGLDVDEFAPTLSFFFNSHNSIFEEVAKFRAARRIYARVMDEWYDAEAEASKTLKFHTQTAGQSLTAQQPLNNVARVTLQALAAVLGGSQSIHTNSYDEALALPSEEAVRVALRTQQIIADESGAADIVDPGGSFAVESLTDEVEEEAMAYIEEIKEMGDGSVSDGVLQGIADGYFHREIQESAYEYQSRVDDGEETVVGVNKYEMDEDTSPDILQIDEDATRDRQLNRLESVKAERDDAAVEETLDALRDAVHADENTIPYIVDAVKAYATMGEIMQVFEDEFGGYQETAAVA